MPEDTEYLPTEKLGEKIGLGERKTIMEDLNELEKKIDEVNRDIPDKTSIRPPLTPPLTNEQKIDMLNQIFPIHLGDRVRNKHSEDGIVESVSIDHRGVLYLVGYKDHKFYWEREDQIQKTTSYGSNDDPSFPKFKTDISE